MLTTLAVRHYRSLRELVVPLAPLTLVTGANGVGKSSLYRALRLLADTAQGALIGSLAREGGLASTLWAGPETIGRAVRRGEAPLQGTLRQRPVSLGLGFAGDEFGYLVDLGLPMPRVTAFRSDPEIKGEYVWSGPFARPAAMLLERRGPLVRARTGRDWTVLTQGLLPVDSVLSELSGAEQAPELQRLRTSIRGWRFYDQFRSDAGAPARQSQIGTWSPVLDHDGANLAAALQTIRESLGADALDAVVDDAFPGSRVTIEGSPRFEIEVHQPGLLRPLCGAEISDGTLRYLLWVAALLSPRPAPLLVLNEPETSLHPDLLPALGRLIVRASATSQLIVVSHAPRLIATLGDAEGTGTLSLSKDFGETVAAEAGLLERPRWHWVER